MKALTIGRAAREAGAGVETIRFYEREGLIEQPPKPHMGVRHYSSETVARIRFIREAQQLGFTLREIRELLALRADPAANCADVREQAAVKWQEVQHKIERLREISAALQTLMAACPGRGSLQACSIIDALELRAGQSAAARPIDIPGAASDSTAPKRSRTATGERNVKSVTYKIEGMHCDGCAQTIKALLESEPGVRSADVSFKKTEARILYEQQAVGEDRLIATIQKPGYRVIGK